LTRISTHDPQSAVSVNLVTSIEAQVSQAGTAVIIDVDAYKAIQVLPGRDILSRELQLLRTVKNAVFFSAITEATAQRYA
jgi:uncharacterized protein (TIGR04255 family)